MSVSTARKRISKLLQFVLIINLILSLHRSPDGEVKRIEKLLISLSFIRHDIVLYGGFNSHFDVITDQHTVAFKTYYTKKIFTILIVYQLMVMLAWTIL
jgi:hypothetical protein